MSSVERILAYTRIDTENYTGSEVPVSWPTEGKLEVRNLIVRYAPHLPPVLRGISFRVEKNERVGVVGRTGPGKSSLILALFRFLEASEGQILIDGVDISTLKIDQLRRRLAIIPQNPVIFRGTIRSNLDPFHDYNDADLLAALQTVRWPQEAPISGEANSGTSTESGGSVSRRLAGGKPRSPLDKLVVDGGENLSQGQRQLLCLAPALIRCTKILVMDEATSSVDKSTDEVIQRTLREVLARSVTTLVIAHRLSTIADFDRILMMDAGRVVEFGTPQELLQVESGVFRGIVEQDTERDILKKIIECHTTID